MPKSKRISKRGGSMMNSFNKSVSSVNKVLKDPENMIIALLSVILLCLVVYYLRMNNEGYEDVDNEKYY